MIDRVRELAERPIADHERRRLFALAAAVLAVAAAAFFALGSDPDPGTRPRPEPGLRAAPAHPSAAADSRAAAAAAERAARRFLPGYLRFIYGRAPARAIDSASPELLRRLARTRLRVPPAARRRRPRVTRLDASQLPSGAVAVSAEVADGGVARYPIILTVRAGARGWRVVAVGAE